MIGILSILLQAIPWYVFPGSPTGTETPTTQVSDKQELVKTEMPDGKSDEPCDTFFVEHPAVITLALPFNTASQPDANAMDFYCGALLAARDLGKSGMTFTLDAKDIYSPSFKSDDLKNTDILIGPADYKALSGLAAICNGKHIISPLDPKVAELCDTLDIIQVPSSIEAQYIDLVKWLASEKMPGDRIFVVKENSGNLSSLSEILVKSLEDAGIQFSFITDFSKFNDPEPETVEANINKFGTDRFLIASETEYFVSEAIRKVSVMSMLRYPVALYCPSRVRSYKNINIEYFHNTRMRCASNYFVDYSDPEVKAFVENYRYLFNAEPGSFAFHGYDLVRYFANVYEKYGSKWFENLVNSEERGIQTAFRFKRKNNHGMVNDATRRFIYNGDWSISLSESH